MCNFLIIHQTWIVINVTLLLLKSIHIVLLLIFHWVINIVLVDCGHAKYYLTFYVITVGGWHLLTSSKNNNNNNNNFTLEVICLVKFEFYAIKHTNVKRNTQHPVCCMFYVFLFPIFCYYCCDVHGNDKRFGLYQYNTS